jgi:hypothetical protein
MRVARPKSLLERDAREDLWLHTLSQIPTLFGKLQYLASLRDPNTGTYEHHGLSLVFGEKEATKAMRQNHKRTFADWLALGLAEQESDLENYLVGLRSPLGEILASWELLEPWKLYVPLGVMASEKALYSADLRTICRILTQRYADDAPGRVA